jgi:chromate reductase
MTTSESNGSIRALGVAGSLREGSYNRALLRAARELTPDGLQLVIFDNETLKQIPLYNQDVRDRGDPPAVTALKDAIGEAHALVIATPEYNHSVAGVLKNALDWASRPPDETPLKGKPVAIMGATTGSWGTVRAQMHLREFFVDHNMPTVQEPEVLVRDAGEKFDEEGRLTHDVTRYFIGELMNALADLVRACGKADVSDLNA